MQKIKTKQRTKSYWQRLERQALAEGDLEFALICQSNKIKAKQFITRKLNN